MRAKGCREPARGCEVALHRVSRLLLSSPISEECEEDILSPWCAVRDLCVSREQFATVVLALLIALLHRKWFKGRCGNFPVREACVSGSAVDAHIRRSRHGVVRKGPRSSFPPITPGRQALCWKGGLRVGLYGPRLRDVLLYRRGSCSGDLVRTLEPWPAGV